MLSEVERDPEISIVDSFGVPVSSFAKAPRHRSFRGVASVGYDSMARAFFLGFRAHVRVVWPGVIVSASLAPANVHDRWVAEDDLLDGLGEGWLVGDANHHSPALAEDLSRRGAELVAPKRTNKKREKHPWPRWLVNLRRRDRDGREPACGTLPRKAGAGPRRVAPALLGLLHLGLSVILGAAKWSHELQNGT